MSNKLNQKRLQQQITNYLEALADSNLEGFTMSLGQANLMLNDFIIFTQHNK